jgi:membrane protease YdiL (CAAX protease family)
MLTFGTLGWSLLIPIVMFNSIAGMIMGWLYMRYGLVSAIVAHSIVDLVAHVIPRLVAAIA